MISGNTFGAVFWSDGWMDAPMMMEYPIIVACVHCGEVFDIEVVTRIEEKDFHQVGDMSPAYLREASEDQCIKYASTHEELNQLREWQIRIRAYQMGNHASRRSKKPRDWSTMSLSNARRLVQICGRGVVEQLIMAEVLRSIGEFDDAVEVLDELTPDDELTASMSRQIRAHLNKRSRQVFEPELPK